MHLLTWVFQLFCIFVTSHLQSVAEEIKDAAIVIPRSMITTVVLNGLLGLAMLTAILFCMGDVDALLNSTFFFPFIPILASVTKSTGGAVGMVRKMLFVTLMKALYAHNRDLGFPYIDCRHGWCDRYSRHRIPHAVGLCA